jgi:2-hydroxychromene-2-carboxylate isomerase
MTTTIDFYFDYLSPFAYLASLAAPDLASRNDARIRWRPVLFAGLLDHWGQLGPAEIPPKAVHAFRACARYATARGIALRSPRFHPFKPLTALRATLAASDEERPSAIRALYEHGWVDGGDLGDPTEIRAALTAAGLDGAALVDQAGTQPLKDLLKQETDAAIARGVFGIPTFILGDELFWGLDQLEYVELVLQGRDPLAAVDFGGLGPEGAAARRPGKRSL